MMVCKDRCELAETIHAVVGKYCLAGAMILLLEGLTEAGLFHMSKGTVFMK